MEERSVLPLHVSVEIYDLGWMVQNLGQLVVQESLVVEWTNLHDDFKGNEVDNAMVNCMLVGQQGNVDNFSKKSTENLNECDHIGDLGATSDEKLGMVVAELH